MELFRKPPHNEKQTNPLTGSSSYVSMKPLDLNNFTKKDVKDYFNNSYNLYETLFATLRYDFVYYLCPDRLRLPLIFYYGHTAAVYVNKLCLAGLIKPKERVNLDFETTFETGVDEMSWDDIEHYRMGGDYKWPSVEETKQFRAKVRELINKVIDRTPLTLPVNWDHPWWAFFMGFEHERIHYETSTVLIRQYPVDMLQRPTCWSYGPLRLGKSVGEVLSNQMIRVDEKQVRLGKSYDFPSYGWDNEYGQVDCKVSAFEASKYKVTNEQFLEFVLSNGYDTREYWSDEGWEWVQYKQARHPLFWVCPMKCKSGCGGQLAAHSHCQEKQFSKNELKFFKQIYSNKENDDNNNSNKNDNQNESNCDCIPFKYRLMFDVVDMPRNWPVEVNYHEARAYCRWRGDDFRLLTEAEHHAIRDRDIHDLTLSNDVIYQKDAKVNHNMAFGSSTPVNMYPGNQKGFHDVFGNVWEWVEDHFNGLPGHRTHFLYDDFSSPCYDGRHNLIMGGSWASTGDECSHFARYMFRRHFYQHCGFRLARSLTTTDVKQRADPHIRLVSDRIFVLGNGFPDNKPDLNEAKLVLNYFPTVNNQYLYDSHNHPEYYDRELVYQFGEAESAKWYNPLLKKTLELVRVFKVNVDIATNLGCSTGRLVFDLTKTFNEVVGVDFCGRFLETALRIQSDGVFETRVNDGTRVIRFDITQNMTADKALFKQMTWIPNEIPKSDLVVFTMIDRVMNPYSWLRRFKEIVKPYGLLIIYSSQKSKWNGETLRKEIGQMFDLKLEVSLSPEDGGDSFTAWRMNETYAIENL